MNTKAISIPLQRSLNKTKQYNKLFPKVSCKATNIGNGKNNTFEGVQFIANWIEKYTWQTEKLVKKLVKNGTIRTNSLAQTVNDVYHFLYTHIQYQADAALQDLRSPACAWVQRFEGVDCKSYTIFAICMLRNLGITAAIRQVRQPGAFSDLWTHVYVIVPTNQSAKNIKEITTYHTLDATKHNNTEVLFIEKNDLLMQAHQYRGLNAPSGPNGLTVAEQADLKRFYPELLNLGFSNVLAEKIIAYISQLAAQGYKDTMIMSFDTGGLIVRPNPNMQGKLFVPKVGLNGDNGSGGDGKSGWGKIISDVFSSGWFKKLLGGLFKGGWYDDTEAKRDSEAIAAYFEGLANNITAAVKQKNYSKLSTAVLKFRLDSASVLAALTKKHSEYSNGGTGKNINAVKLIAERIHKNGGAAVDAWLNQYFSRNVVKTHSQSSQKTEFIGWAEQNVLYVNPRPTVTAVQESYSRKNNQAVKAFVLDPSILEIDASQFNGNNFLDKIKDIVLPGSNTNTGGSNGGSTNIGNTNNNDNLQSIIDKIISNVGNKGNNGNQVGYIDNKRPVTAPIKKSSGVATASMGILGVGALVLAYPTLKKMLSKNKVQPKKAAK